MRGRLIARKLSVFAMSSQISAPTPVNFVLSTSDGCQNRVGGGGYGSLISRRHLGVEARTLLPEVVRRVRNAVPEVRSCRARAAGCQTTLDRGWRRIDVFFGQLCRCQAGDERLRALATSHVMQSRDPRFTALVIVVCEMCTISSL